MRVWQGILVFSVAYVLTLTTETNRSEDWLLRWNASMEPVCRSWQITQDLYPDGGHPFREFCPNIY